MGPIFPQLSGLEAWMGWIWALCQLLSTQRRYVFILLLFALCLLAFSFPHVGSALAMPPTFSILSIYLQACRQHASKPSKEASDPGPRNPIVIRRRPSIPHWPPFHFHHIAFHIDLHRRSKSTFNARHLARLTELSRMAGFTGTILPGIQLRAEMGCGR
ncbi:hypothetical protein BDZ89DRAFT_727375 [Hymenopellis radicata]|nr:hypothetical protein BDZ89DRAFT_727375 [Hymenopellis radicata]